MNSIRDLIQSCYELKEIGPTLTTDQENAFLRKWAPILYFHSKEASWPSSVNWYFQHTKLVQDDGTRVLDPIGPPTNLQRYVNNNFNYRIEIIDQNTRKGQKELLPNGIPVYGSVIPQGNYIQIHYHFFYPFNGNIFDIKKVKDILKVEIAVATAAGFLGILNPFLLPIVAVCAIALQQGIQALNYLNSVQGLEMHEGDWEHITVFATSESADSSEIVAVYYAAHQDEGQWAIPSGKEDPFISRHFSIDPQSGRPLVYVAKESHASYPEVKEYTRLKGFANDKVELGPIKWDPQDNIVNTKDGLDNWGTANNISWGADQKHPVPIAFGLLNKYAEYTNGPGTPSWTSAQDGAHPFIAGPTYSDKAGWDNPKYYATIQCADIDGDGQEELIARSASGIETWKYNPKNRKWDRLADGPGLSDSAGWDKPKYYETIQCADINGDGHEELIARSASGIQAWVYNQENNKWERLPDGPGLSDGAGWDKPKYYETIRCADIDGDGQAELIARSASGIQAWKYNHENNKWERLPDCPGLSDKAGWDNPKYYQTIRFADIDGDGQAELLARNGSNIEAWKYDQRNRKWDRLPDGPGLSDGAGWDNPKYYQTIQFADIDGDGHAELIARSASGIQPWKYNPENHKWDRLADNPGLSDGAGWDDPKYYETIQCADIDGDGQAELIARNSQELITWKYNKNDQRWDNQLMNHYASFFSDQDWAKPQYYTTLQCSNIDKNLNGTELIARNAKGILVCWWADILKS